MEELGCALPEDTEGFDMEELVSALSEDQESLSREHLERFRLYVRRRIPWDDLGELDPSQMVRLLIRSLGRQEASNLIRGFLTISGQREVLPLPRASEDERNKYREQMRKKFQSMMEKNFYYQQLQLLLQYQHEEKQNELLVQGWELTEVMKKEGRLIEVSDLFSLGQKTDIQPHTFVLQGTAGIGKTTLAIKVMLDWAEGKIFQERFDFVFFLTSRAMNSLGEKEISLADLIAKHWSGPQAPMAEIMSHSERLLFIIDGLDELKFPCNEPIHDLCKDWKQQRPVSLLLSSLLRKTLLPKASLLLTARPTAVGKFRSLLKNPRHVKILGFSTVQRLEYFIKFFRKRELGEKAFSLVEGNDTLLTMCSVPLMNWIVCTCLKQQMERGRDPMKSLKTTTALYVLYISVITPDDKTFECQHLKGLCSLAAEGIWERKLLFEEEDLRRHDLEAADVSAFLDMNIFQKDSDCENCYSFIHLSFQEFLAALFYVMSTDKEGRKSPDFSIPDVKNLLEKYRANDASFVVPVVHFLFGFLNAEPAKELEKKFGCRMSPEIKTQLLQFVKGEVKRDFNHRCYIFSYFPVWYSHLYETQDAKFIIQALANIHEIRINVHKQNDALHEIFFIKHCPEPCSISFFSISILPVYIWKDLLSVVNKKQNLRQLTLTSLQIVDASLENLCVELRNPNSKLEELKLSGFRITYSCCQYLCSSPSLKSLALKYMFFVDDGKKLPHDTLKENNCQLETLKITHLQLFGETLEFFSSAFINNENLKNLDLSYTHIEKDSIQFLCNVLVKQNCKLQTLSLAYCHLTPACSQILLSALSSNESLKDLELTENFFEEEGIKFLCKALESPNCKLEKLSLAYCLLAPACSQTLFSTLNNSKNLESLNLNGNSFEKEGIKLLYKALGNPNCTLNTLWLQHAKFSKDMEEELKNLLKIKHSRKDIKIFLDPDIKEEEEEYYKPSQEHWKSRSEEDPQIKPEVTSSLSSFDSLQNKVLDLERCHNVFLGPNGPVQLELTDKNSNRYRVHLPMAGFYHWPDTGLGVSVRSEVTLDIEFASWNQHLEETEKQSWMIAGPLFNIRVDPGIVTSLHLPHFIYLQERKIDISLFKIAHFKEEGMVLENPTRMETSHAILENPSFSPMGVLLRILYSTIIPIHATTLIYYRIRNKDITLHLYLIPSDCTIRKAIDKEEAKFHFLRLHKPPPVTPLYIDSIFLVTGSKHLKIMPAVLKLSYQSVDKCQQFSEIHSKNLKKEISLNLNDQNGKRIWETLVRSEDIELACATVSSVPTAPEAPFVSPGLHFVDRYRDQIISRVTSVDMVLDKLYNQLLSNQEYEQIRSEKTNPDKMRQLFSFSISWDKNYKDYFHKVLIETHPHLMNEIQNS